jgi:hypothetical protein
VTELSTDLSTKRLEILAARVHRALIRIEAMTLPLKTLANRGKITMVKSHGILALGVLAQILVIAMPVASPMALAQTTIPDLRGTWTAAVLFVDAL